MMKAHGNKRAVRRTVAIVAIAMLCVSALVSSVPAQNNYVELPRPVRTIELAICLDASGSMSGLIDAAKQKLWAIVNDLALAEPTPELRVALFTYGNDGHEPQDGWVALQTPFTTDLDLVSERLFAVTTNGGTEFVGRVLRASSGLAWSPANEAMQLIVVAGNESADQDTQVSFRDMCTDLIGRGIVVHSIYCGSPEDGIAPGWREVAQLADGHFASIDHNTGTVAIATPFDERLGALSSELNLTYIPFGASGHAGAANQAAQDVNAEGMNSAASASRAKAKASDLYSCRWDLIDACRSGDVKLAEVKTEDLPEEMQSLDADERREYVEQMSKTRAEVKEQIAELSTRRDEFVREEMKRKSIDDSKAFDAALRKAIREQAIRRGFEFKDERANAADEPSRESADVQRANATATLASASTTLGPVSVAESNTIKDIFARATLIRPGDARKDSRTLISKTQLVPDLVVLLKSGDDLRQLRSLVKPDRIEELPSPNEVILHLDGKAILVVYGC